MTKAGISQSDVEVDALVLDLRPLVDDGEDEEAEDEDRRCRAGSPGARACCAAAACRPAPRPRRCGAEVAGCAPHRRRTLVMPRSVTSPFECVCAPKRRSQPAEGDNGRMGEFELLARMRERLPAGGPRMRLGSGDDAAMTVPGGATATSVDALVDGVHFRRERATPAPDRPQGAGHGALRPGGDGCGAGRGLRRPRAPARPRARTSASSCSTAWSPSPAATGTDARRRRRHPGRRALPRVTVVGHAPRAGGLRQPRRRPTRRRLVLTGELGGAAAGLPCSRPSAAPTLTFAFRTGGSNAQPAMRCARASSSPRPGSRRGGRSPLPGRRR